MVAIVVLLGSLAVGGNDLLGTPKIDNLLLPVDVPPLTIHTDLLHEAKVLALAQGKPLVIGVGVVPPRDCPEWVSVQVESHKDYAAPAFVVAIPKDGKLIWKATIKARIATRTDVFQALGWAPAYPTFRRRWNPDTQPTFQPYYQSGTRPPPQSSVRTWTSAANC